MKKIVFFATAILAMAACTSDEFTGESRFDTTGGTAPISFGSATGQFTRATGAEAATALGNSFNVYATKTVGTTTSNVFAKEAYSTATDYNATPYIVTWANSTAGTTASNTSNWEYVNGTDQTIKYWDYSANQYEFVAYKATVGNPTISKYQKDGFTVEATDEQLAGLYIADKLTITTKNDSPTMPAAHSDYNKIGDIVQFTFRAGASKVRLGIYETINGYVVKNVNFRPAASEFTATTDNAKLSGSFNGEGVGGTTKATYTVTYDTTTGVAVLDAAATATNNFNFGTFTSTADAGIGTASTAPTWAGGSAAYHAVRPNTDNVGNMTLCVDYDLYNAASGEVISVKNARAVVPAIYMKWNPNYAYTYLFKISDNTNGTTGVEGTSPEGLFPITFDAVTMAVSDGAEVGNITTVATPAITTFQDGSVSAAGITYAHGTNPIYVTVNTAGTLETLTTTNTKLYTVPAGTTEADLVLASVTMTDATGLTILGAAEEVKGINFAANTTAKFTPAAAGTYAVEFTDGSSVKHYKVIIVA